MSGNSPRARASALRNCRGSRCPSRRRSVTKSEWQAAHKLFRDGHQSAYEKEASFIYGLLREAWERALEEVLLGGVVERFRPGIQTQQVGKIADITEEDCKTL